MSCSRQILNLNQPFYSDLLARSLLRIGIPKFESYRIAHDIWKQCSHTKASRLKLSQKVIQVLKENHPHLIQSYKNWQKIIKKEKPLIIFLCGATGVGTSTLAVRLAWLLEINRIASSDSVREVIRQFLPREITPLLNVSTYQTASLMKGITSFNERLIYGFISQSRKVLYGIDALLRRAIKEKESIVIEGVHLIPGEMDFLKKYKHRASIMEIMLDVKHTIKHREHFYIRHIQNASRPRTRYLQHFKEIRLIRNYLIQQAEKYHIPIVENYDLRQAEKAILEKIYSEYVHQDS